MKTFLADYVIVKNTDFLSGENLAKWEVKKQDSEGGLSKQFCQPSDAKSIFGEHDTVQECGNVEGFTPLVWEKVLDNQEKNPTKITEVAKVSVKLGGSATPFDVKIKLQKANEFAVTYTEDKILTVKYIDEWQAANNVPEKINELLKGVCAGFSAETGKKNTFTFGECDSTYTKALTCDEELFWNTEDNLGSCNGEGGFFLRMRNCLYICVRKI